MPHSSKDGDTIKEASSGKASAAAEVTAASTAIANAVGYAAKLAALRRFAIANERKVQQDRRAAEFGA